MGWSEVPIGGSGGTHRFHTTRWTLVASSAASDPASRRALEDLCRIYWPPIYAYARRRGHNAQDALDLTQGFFLDLLERGAIPKADWARGRFRTFLLTCFGNFLANQHDKESAEKRGGNVQHVSLDWFSDVGEVEKRYGLESGASPEDVFDRQWAIAMLGHALDRVRAEYAERGRQDVFDALEVLLREPDPAATYREIGERIGKSEGAIKVTVHRLRQRFREVLVEEVSHTIDDGGDEIGELERLLGALGSQ